MEYIRRVIRRNFAETNSSSTHSLIIGSNDFVNSPIPIERDSDGNILVEQIEIPSYSFKTNDPNDKLRFIYMLVCTMHEEGYSKYLNLIRQVVIGYTGAPGIKFNWGQSDIRSGDVYVFNWSMDNYLDIMESKETLKNFIFNPRSWLFLTNDETEKKRKFFNVTDPVPSNTKFIAQVFLPEPVGRVDIELSCLPETLLEGGCGYQTLDSLLLSNQEDSDLILDRLIFDSLTNRMIGNTETKDNSTRYYSFSHLLRDSAIWENNGGQNIVAFPLKYYSIELKRFV